MFLLVAIALMSIVILLFGFFYCCSVIFNGITEIASGLIIRGIIHVVLGLTGIAVEILTIIKIVMR